ncbi:MAG: universal stress protein [Bacteroidia bacterium]|nr:universal stress protein [Bacteroidia bacterium]
MGKLLAAIDYHPASATALRALLPLRRALRDTLVVYHAYQLPRGLPFLSPHIIEKMEREAETEEQQKMRLFLSEQVPAAERRGIRLLAQREFPSEGVERHLEEGNYSLLAVGAQGTEEEEQGALGFHSRYFIHHSPIPTLVTFPESVITWKRVLVAYDSQYRSLRGMRFLRRLAERAQSEIVGLAMIRPSASIDKLHKRLQRMTHASSYTRVVWDGPHLVRLLSETARSYGADVIALFSPSKQVVEGMRQLTMAELSGHAAWLFLPSSADAGGTSDESIEE